VFVAEQDSALNSSSSHLVLTLVMWPSDYFHFTKIIVSVTFFSLFDDGLSVSYISIALLGIVMIDELGVSLKIMGMSCSKVLLNHLPIDPEENQKSIHTASSNGK
jgi:hypothetical protein